MDGYLLELRRSRALAQLAMYEATLRSVSARAAYARELVEAAGADWDEWCELPVVEREAVLARGRKALRTGRGG